MVSIRRRREVSGTHKFAGASREGEPIHQTLENAVQPDVNGSQWVQLPSDAVSQGEWTRSRAGLGGTDENERTHLGEAMPDRIDHRAPYAGACRHRGGWKCIRA